MKELRYLLQSRYTTSRALVIGINNYTNVEKLDYAVNDAEGFKQLLVEVLEFDESNVTLLLDSNATRENILQHYLRFTREDIAPDDRIIIFFAGHGETWPSMRGDVGFLVPYDAQPDAMDTCIRWDELTRYSDMVRAKHVWFVMDACYGGLALTRSAHAGATRFARDMLKRFCVQVLTAGKADELVSDANGPLAGHSVFTGHLIQGIRDAASLSGATLTVSGIMAQVYANVAQDKYSNQTPSFGYIAGDGDMILVSPLLKSDVSSPTMDDEHLVQVRGFEQDEEFADLESKIQAVKQMLPDPSSLIALHDLVVKETKRLISKTGGPDFMADRPLDKKLLGERLEKYERISFDIALIGACMAQWKNTNQLSIYCKLFARSCDSIRLANGYPSWLALQSYPLLITAYAAGISAVEAGRYDSINHMLSTKALLEHSSFIQGGSVAQVLSSSILQLSRAEVFKQIPGHEKNFTPMSEYLHKLLQPKLDEVFFMGTNYDNAFDEFEVLLAMSIIDEKIVAGERAWAPLGRFAWKSRHYGNGAFDILLKDIERAQREWKPVQHGMFAGDINRATQAAGSLAQLVQSVHWY